MVKDGVVVEAVEGVAAGEIRSQVERLCRHPLLTSSKRSAAFLKYVVDETLRGGADTIKERTIGIDLYRRSPTYDTSVDHVVRTAALELRKRLAIYYGDPRHSAELRISLMPGSYVPRFTWPTDAAFTESDPERCDRMGDAHASEADRVPVSPSTTLAARQALRMRALLAAAAGLLAVLGIAAGVWFARSKASQPANAERLFWAPLIKGTDPILIAVGTERDGLPRAGTSADGAPLVIPGPAAPRYIPYADAVTTANVAGELRAMGRKVQIRRAVDTTISDLRQMPVVLVGAFDNPWSLRLTQGLRYSPEVDEQEQVVYIRDAKAPASRAWRWKNEPQRTMAGAYGSPVLHDYALISRVHDARTGRMALLIAGLEPYGTQAAGEFVTDPERMAALAQSVSLADGRNLQIVLETTVTDGSPGSPRVVAISQE